MRVINLAGEWLDGIHTWHQQLRVSAQLDFTLGDTTLTLPANLRSIVAAEQSGSTGLGRLVRWVGPREMLLLRQGLDSFGAFDVFVSIESTGTGWTLGLFQTPSATTADVLRISYYAGWTNLGTDEKAQVMIHPSREGLLQHVVREYAAGLELNDLDDRLANIANLEKRGLLYQAIVADAGPQRVLGPLVGSPLQGASDRDPDWNDWMRDTEVTLS